MKKLALVVALMLPGVALADDTYLGTITSTGTSVTNGTTSSTFKTSGLSGHVSLQCDAAAYVRAVSASSGTVTSSNGVKLAADQLYDLDLLNTKFVAVISVSGTANCKLFARQ